ncbi:MAG: GNAT family N-acetyltransferase [Deltaproteobacteria bacterium]|nr:GNAT family N-acetyltransferase [Deltaproteobacteria bacterium]
MLQDKLTVLRPVEEKDIPYYSAWINEPELARLVLGSAAPISRNVMSKTFGTFFRSSDRNLLFAIDGLPEGKLIGFCFLKNVHPVHRFAELEQFFIGEKKYRQNGYGRDALQTLIKYAFNELNLNRIWLITYNYNQAAIRFYEKEGFIQEGVLRQIQFTCGRYYDGILMAVLREDWAEKNA